MKLKVKDMDIATGGPLIAIINYKDAKKLDLHTLDRIKLIKGKKVETVIVDIGESRRAVPPGSVGVFEEVIDSLGLKRGDSVELMLARKPLSLDIIRRKLDGYKLSRQEINQVVWDIVHNKLNDVELTYFVSACYTNSLSFGETKILTEAMASHGETLKLKSYPIIDKHCIGGVPGNRTTLILVPILAAAGLTIPKTSSRSITSPAGTADTMEVLAKVSFCMDEMKNILKKTGACIVWGGALNLAPADDKIIRVEKPLNIDAESQLLASILAKKLSVSSTDILIDIPSGKGSKVKSKRKANELKTSFEEIGKKLGLKIKVIITDGSQPIGNGIGPALEARDVLWVLMGDKMRPADLEKKCIMMAAEVFRMVGIPNGKKKAQDILDSGAAYKKMMEIIKAQGGNPCIRPEEIKLGKFTLNVRAKASGVVKHINNEVISKLARIAGAPQSIESGIYLFKHLGQRAKKGEKILTVFAQSREKIKHAADVLKTMECFEIE